MKTTNLLPALGLLVVILSPACSSVHKLTHVEQTRTDSSAHFTATRTIIERADTTVRPPADSVEAEIPYTDTAVHYVKDNGITLAVQFKTGRTPPVVWGTPADHLGGSPMLDVDVKAVSTPSPVTVAIQKTTTETVQRNLEVKMDEKNKITDKTRTGLSIWIKMGIGVIFIVLLVAIGWTIYKKISPVKI